MTFTEVMEHVAQAFEGLGVLVLAAGTLWSFLISGVTRCRSQHSGQAHAVLRQALGGTLLLGLEILVAAGLLRTIAVAPTLNNVLILGVIVLIRTFLSFSLEIEITGVPPWRRGAVSGTKTISQVMANTLKPGRPDQSKADRSG